MGVHIDPIVLTVRFYEDGKSYANKDDYEAVATVQLDRGTAYISAAHGTLHQYSRELLRQLKEMGVKRFRWVRSSGKEVTGEL